jgi:hypothetical protein
MLLNAGLTWLLSLPRRGWCRWASLPRAPIYDMQLSDEATGLST